MDPKAEQDPLRHDAAHTRAEPPPTGPTEGVAAAGGPLSPVALPGTDRHGHPFVDSLPQRAQPPLRPATGGPGTDLTLPTRVVAIGASAGGLESMQQLFAAVPDHTGMAFVVVQHLSPDFKSLMPDLLGRQTRMPVLAIDRDLPLRPNTVYVLSAGYGVVWQDDRLRAIPRAHDGELNLPINRLFESLKPLGERAACVVLSGTGQDGMAGAKLLRRAGALVIAQVPSSARFDSMPRAVIDAGVADIIALPGEMGRALVQWLADPESGRRFTSEASEGDSLMSGPYGPVLQVLQRSFDLDFNHYKSGTIMRRIDRWLTAGGRPISPASLAAHLEEKPSEVDRLFGDLMIGVTSFFRDPDAFEVLRTKGIEPLIDALGERDMLRVWVCGCSTGEEAYTIAMLADEAFEQRGMAPRIRVLATDVHAASVQKASTGVYLEENLGEMSEARRHKYFTELPSGLFKVNEGLRRHVVFSVQNVLRDAGFQRIDIVSCRNMLIYLRPQAQAQALASFHLALHAGGLLFLGKSELPSEHAEAFLTVDEGAHLFRKRPGLQLPIQARPLFGLPAAARPAMSMPLDKRASFRLQEVLAQRYVPSGFLVNQNDELVYIFGDAGRFLQAAPGRFGGTMFNLLTGPLRTAVTMSLRKAAHSMTPASVSQVAVDEDDPGTRLRVDVDPITDRTLPHHYFMVRLTPMLEVSPPAPPSDPAPDPSSGHHIAELETELMRTREALQRSIEDLEAANEELQAGNEELMAANEELQSSNEELHALNEELYSVNAEHELKIQELRDTSADLNNLIRATELPIIFLDLEGRLRLFTRSATELYPMRPEDIGRELSDLVPREADPTLFHDIADTLTGAELADRELTLTDGRILRRRVSPYRTDMGLTTGLVITYVEITPQVRLREQEMVGRHQAQLKAIVESVPHLMWTTTAEGACDFLSPQWEAYTGIPADPQLGAGWLQQVHPDDREALTQAWQLSVDTGRPLRTHFRIRRHDGAYRWFDTRGVAELDAEGRVREWFGSNTDVHEVVELQKELERRERFAQMVANHINATVGYWDRHQHNLFANERYLQWFGRTADQVRGQTLREVLGDEVYEQNRHHVEAALHGQAQQFEHTVRTADGRPVHLLTRYEPHLVDDEVLGFIATTTDITEAQEARVLADQIFKVSPAAKMIIDHRGRLVRWNPAAQKLLGYPAERMDGLPLESLIPAGQRQRHARLYEGFLATPSHRPMGDGRSFPMVRADGTQVDVEIELSGVTVGGKPAAIAAAREVTLSPHASHKLDIALQARNSFLAQMSHEIRTPLNAILGMAQLLELESPTARQLDRLRRIEEASTLLLDIVNDVLDLSKMEAGRLPLVREPFSVSDLVDRSLAMVTEKAKLKKLELAYSVSPGVPHTLMGDGRRIEQILVNLLSNAVKFTHEGRIDVEVSSAPAAQQRVLLSVNVKDTGIGIAPDDIDKLFTPFKQLHTGHTRAYGGTGLGLSICRQLARAMQGDCGVSSTPGHGSSFWVNVMVELPDDEASGQGPEGAIGEATRQPVASGLARPTTRSGIAHMKGRRVLVVEDNAINRVVLQELLTTALGLDVTTAEDGQSALEQAREGRYDLVLMDVQMPGIDGLETTRRLRQMSGFVRTPIYALTANVHADDINACVRAGMDGHFGKPLIIDQLLPVLRTLWPSEEEAVGRPSAPARLDDA